MRQLRLSIAILTIILASTQVLNAGETRMVYRFEKPSIKDAGGGFSRILFPNTVQAGRTGEPSYPYRKVQILLPGGERVQNVRIEKRGWKKIDRACRLYPRQRPAPLSLGTRRRPRFAYKSEAYEASGWIYPARSEFSTHYLRGHSIATGSFTPAGFRASTSEAGYYREVEAIIETSPDIAGRTGEPRNDSETAGRLTSLVDNPEAVEAGMYSAGENDYDYLIVTRDSLAPAFGELADFYNRRGFLTSIMTVEEIETGYSGDDTAEKIRNAVIDQYLNHGITHLLLGGDGDGDPGTGGIVPYRGFYCAVQSSSYIEDDDIPSDLYYAALDGNWNGDGDSLWGEPGEEDFYSEVAVGRAVVEGSADVSVFVNKTGMYQESPVASNSRCATLFGEHLYSDPLTYGGDEMDQLIGYCDAYGFTTEGLPPDFDIIKLYERDGSWYNTSVYGAFNMGTNWIAHSGHSGTSYVMKLYSGDITNTNFLNDGANAGFPIVYTYGCYAGAFDVDRCIGERMVMIDHCASAFLGNSRYGWFTEGTTNGPSHHFQREFYDAVFTEGITRLGAANQRSKDETAPFVDLPDEYEPGAHRWCFYTLNLLGDPAMDGWTDTPTSLFPAHAGYLARSDTLFAVDSYQAGALGALYRGGTCYGRGYADEAGRITIDISTPIPQDVDTLVLTVTAHDRLVYREDIIVDTVTDSEDPRPLLSLGQNVPNPFNPATTISFSLKKEGYADLRAYDISGREVDIIARGNMEAGVHTVRWLPQNLSSGVYFYVLKTAEGKISRKAVLLR